MNSLLLNPQINIYFSFSIWFVCDSFMTSCFFFLIFIWSLIHRPFISSDKNHTNTYIKIRYIASMKSYLICKSFTAKPPLNNFIFTDFWHQTHHHPIIPPFWTTHNTKKSNMFFIIKIWYLSITLISDRWLWWGKMRRSNFIINDE